MYTEYHDYAWKSAKQHLDHEIGKLEGQLKNCRDRLDRIKREMIVCIMTVVIPFLVVLLLQTFPTRVNEAVFDDFIFISTSVISFWLLVIYICSLPFLAYAMVKSIMLYLLNQKSQAVKEPLIEVTGNYRDIPEPEKSCALEEDKLVRILSNYYGYRRRLEELQEGLKGGELSMTVEELQEEIDSMVFYREIVPASAFNEELKVKAKLITVMVCIVLVSIMLFKNAAEI